MRLVFASLLSVIAVPAAAAWQPTFVVGKTVGFTYPLAVAPNGTVAVLFSQTQKCGTTLCTPLRARLRSPAGTWGPVEAVTSDSIAGQQIVARPNGGFTAIWLVYPFGAYSGDVFTADRINGAWTAPRKLGATANSLTMATNTAGQQVIA